MPSTFSAGFLAIPCIFVGASCASLNATDPVADPDAGQTPGTTQGTVGTLCSSAIDACGWTALECSSDAGCAHWYACVLDCHPVHGLQGCLDDCSEGKALGPSGTALQKCLSSEGIGACGASSDAATKEDPEAGPAAEDSSTTDAQLYASCADCVWGSCQAEINGCATTGTGSSDCLSYKTIFEKCAQSSTQLDFEKCMLAADKESSAAHDAFASSDAMACISAHCTTTCVPAGYQPCVECTRSKCADAFDAWLHDALAQDLTWCRDACAGDSACVSECKAKYGEGAGVLSALIACQSQSCPSCGH